MPNQTEERKNPTLKISLAGQHDDCRRVSITVFAAELTAIKAALVAEDKEVSAEGQALGDYEIVDITHDSPYTVSVRRNAASQDPVIEAKIYQRVCEGIRHFRTGTNLEGLGKRRKLYEDIVRPVDHDKIRRLEFCADDNQVIVDKTVQPTAEIAPKEEVEIGSISGKMDKANFHDETRQIWLSPIAGPRRVTCVFKDEMRSKVRTGLDRYVTVFGTLHYKAGDPYPHLVDLDDIEVHPTDDELPSLADLHAIAPNATKGVEAEKAVRRLRDEWE